MSQETRRAIAFISGGCLLAGAIGFGVWQVSDPANFSTASQVHEAGHTQTETATVTETTSASESTARAGAATRGTAGQNANDNSAATQEHSRNRSTPHSLADAHGLPTTPRGSQNSRRAQIDAADPFLPPHAVIQADPKPVEPTVVYCRSPQRRECRRHWSWGYRPKYRQPGCRQKRRFRAGQYPASTGRSTTGDPRSHHTGSEAFAQ